MRGKVEACAQGIKTAEQAQTFAGLRGKRRAGFGGKISIGAGFGTPDAAANLVQLAKPEHIGAVYDHCVGGGDIQTRFHNRCGQKHIVFAIVELVHPVV